MFIQNYILSLISIFIFSCGLNGTKTMSKRQLKELVNSACETYKIKIKPDLNYFLDSFLK